jgi:hypothetical protein
LPGIAVDSSAVTRDSGTAQTKGNTKNPRMAKRGPAACTAGSAPYGPPATSKKMRKMRGNSVNLLRPLSWPAPLAATAVIGRWVASPAKLSGLAGDALE